MPSQHKNPAAVYRPEPQLYRRAQAAAGEVGSDMNAHIIAFLHWLVGDTDEIRQRIREQGIAVLQAYLDAGGDPNAIDREGYTLLMNSTGHEDRLRLLLERGATPASVSLYGETALSIAATAGRAAAYEYLYPLTPRKLRKPAEFIKAVMIERGQWK